MLTYQSAGVVTEVDCSTKQGWELTKLTHELAHERVELNR
jgi:uncharacterized protein YjhX (UPF0386 family)